MNKFVCCALVALASVGATRTNAKDTSYRVSAAYPPYFFVDPQVAEDRWNADRFAPEWKRHPANPLITTTGAWEGSGPHMGGSVLFDPEDQLFKMWYCVFNEYNYDNNLPFSYNIAYAESEDGITWTKPALGVFQHDADPANNLIRLGEDKTQNIDVMLNPRRDLVPAKFLAIHNQKGGVFLSSSDDGKVFTMLPQPAVIPYHSDTHNNFVYDDVEERWLLYCRPRAYAGDHKRRTSFMQSKDLKNWTHDKVILIPSEGERPEYYGMGVFRQHDLFLGLRQSYDRADALLYPEWVWSDDGEHWDAIGTHPPALKVGPPGAWDAGMLLVADNSVIVGDEVRFYYGGFALSHDEPDNRCAIGLATAERDRLIGLRPSGEGPGFVLTKPFIVPEGAKLRLNAIVHEGGSIRAELRTDLHKKIEDYLYDDSDPQSQSGYEVPITWGGKELGTLAGQEVRFRLEFTNTELFSYTLTETP